MGSEVPALRGSGPPSGHTWGTQLQGQSDLGWLSGFGPLGKSLSEFVFQAVKQGHVNALLMQE